MKAKDDQAAVLAGGPSAPDPSPATRRRRFAIGSVVGAHGLTFIGVLLIVVFSVALPHTFPTELTVRGILTGQVPVLLLAFGETVVIACGQYDLSVGYGIGATSIIVIVLQVHSPHLPWGLAVAVTIAAGLLIGLVNGVLVHFAKIDSFIATLGVGYAVYGFSLWYTGGGSIGGILPPTFTRISGATVIGIPFTAVVTLAVAILLWIGFEFLPVGRYLYALGSNARASQLVGIPRGRYVIGAFIASGLMIGVGGVFIGSEVGIAQSNLGPEYLLPAFVGALLGSTAIRPGRVNIWGTVIAVLVLSVGVAGLEQLGAEFFAEPLFDGITLVVAVGVAGYFTRRRRQGS